MTQQHTPYSAEWIRQIAEERKASWLGHHDCGLCGEWVGYSIRGDSVHFHSGCGCGSSPPRPSSFDDIANWLAMQRSDEVRDRIMSRLGA